MLNRCIATRAARIDENIQFEKVDGGRILDSKLIKGVLISKEILNPKMPKFVKNARIALINEKLYFEKPTEEDLKIEINIMDPDSLSELNFAQNKLTSQFKELLEEFYRG